jgi:hypothetical protein
VAEMPLMLRIALICCTALGATAAHGQDSPIAVWMRDFRERVLREDGPPVLQPLARNFPIQPLPIPDPRRMTVVVHYDDGGYLHEYVDRWSQIAVRGNQVKILDICASACTLVTAYISKDRLCFGPNAALDFHQARHNYTDTTGSPKSTLWMIEKYPDDIRDWIEAQGGREKMPVLGSWTLPASDLWKMGYRKCSS